MTENASRRVDEAELVVDKMFFMGSDSHEYCCPRGISQKLAADQCCSCPVVGLESFGNVEVAAFWSSEKSVDVLCQGAVVHSFWYPEDTILKIKILPMDTRESELYAESTLAAGVVLVVATLNRGLVVYCVGMQCASSEGRFRSAYITELPTDLATTFENFRIRGITATMVGDDALIVTTTSIPQECLPGSSHRVLMSYYSLPDIIAIVCDHIGNDTWSTKESRTAVIMEDMSTIKDLVVRREEQGQYTVAILTSIELCCLQVTIYPYFAVGTPVSVEVPKFHPTQRLGTAVSLIQCQLMGEEIKFCALCRPRRAVTFVMKAEIDKVVLQQEVDNTLKELQMPSWMSGLDSPSVHSAEAEHNGQYDVIDLTGRIGLDNGSALSPLNSLMSVREKTTMEVVESPGDHHDQLAHLVFFRIRLIHGVPKMSSFTTPLPSAISDFESVFVEEVASCADQETIVCSGDTEVHYTSMAQSSTSGGHVRFRFCYLTINSNRLHVANVLVQHNLLSTQLDSFETIDTFNNLHDKPSGGKVRGFGMISRGNDQLRVIVSRKPTAQSRPSLRMPVNVIMYESCKIVMAYFTRAPKSCKDGDKSLASADSQISESFPLSSGVFNNIDDDGSQAKDQSTQIVTPDCTENSIEACPSSDVIVSGYGPSTDCQEESKDEAPFIKDVVAAQTSVAGDRTSSERLSIEEKMDFMIQSMAKFQVSVLERMDNLESAIRYNSERIKVLEDNIISYQAGKLNQEGDSWFESVFQG